MKTPRKPAKPSRSSAKPKARRSPARSAKAKATPSAPRTRKAPSRGPKEAPPPHEPPEAEARTTTDLEEIKAWVEQRGGKPATVKGTAPEHEAGLLRIDFPGYTGEDTLEAISWEDWYAKFQEKNLAFLYQEKTKDGHESRFFKLISKG